MSTTQRLWQKVRRAVIDFRGKGAAVASARGIVWIGALAVLFLAFGVTAPSEAQRPPRRNGERRFVAGEIVVWVKAGAGALDDVQRAADGVNADVVAPLRMQDVYHLRLRAVDGKPPTDAQTLDAVAKLKQNPLFRFAGPNRLFYFCDTVPNDPRYPEQWHLPLMKLPKAWDLEKGDSSVILAVIDSGVEVSHPDLQGRLLPGINTGAGNPNDLTDNVPHGTHVIGIAAAVTNNGVGVAGVAFEGVKVLPIKSDLTQTSLINALQFADDQDADVVNMSLGGADSSDTPDLSDPFNAKILQMAQQGTVFTIAAGNEFDLGNPPENPANMASVHENILCVAACGPNKEHAFYSNARPYTTITAPGGNDPTFADTTRQILSTLPAAFGSYGFHQGTSMSAPAAAGVVALLLSIPGVQPSDIRQILAATASPRYTPPNDQFGYGVIDAYEAVQLAAVSVIIVEPVGVGGKASGGIAPDPQETKLTSFRIKINQVPPSNLTIRLDDVDVPSTEYTITNVVTRDDEGTPLRYDVVFERILNPGSHKIHAEGTSAGDPPLTTSDTVNFSIQPHIVPAGLSFIAIPYFEDNAPRDGNLDSNVTPELYFGGGSGYRLARWLPGVYYPGGEGASNAGQYVFYTDNGTKDQRASFTPGDINPHQDGSSVVKAPIGLAFWTRLRTATPILTEGQALTDRPLVIPLKGTGTTGGRFISWNMIGDPFPFDVPFNALLVDTPEGRLAIREAADKGYLLPNIYTYDSESGYTFRTLPDGALRAWNGHWVGVTSNLDLALVIPPLKGTRAAATTRAPVAGRDGWSLRLSASVRDLRDTFNFIGVTSRASDAYDVGDVMKPPLVSPYVSVGIHNDGWGNRSGIYAQDLRAPGANKTWNVVVSTDQPESDVIVSWGGAAALPRNLKLFLKDEATGQVVDMRTRASITFKTDASATPRRFTITAKSGTGPALRISNITVRPNGNGSRAVGNMIGFTLSSDANYEVKILNASGKAVGTVASRAAAAGDVRLFWNGKDAAGRSVPVGTYLVQIRASNSDGDAVRVIQPFAVVR